MVSFSGDGSFNMLTVVVVTGICSVMTGCMGGEMKPDQYFSHGNGLETDKTN
jgi:hypothetical protein